MSNTAPHRTRLPFTFYAGIVVTGAAVGISWWLPMAGVAPVDRLMIAGYGVLPTVVSLLASFYLGTQTHPRALRLITTFVALPLVILLGACFVMVGAVWNGVGLGLGQAAALLIVAVINVAYFRVGRTRPEPVTQPAQM
jgi:uncharacterized membrane protein YagU involved in acid resistance